MADSKKVVNININLPPATTSTKYHVIVNETEMTEQVVEKKPSGKSGKAGMGIARGESKKSGKRDEEVKDIEEGGSDFTPSEGLTSAEAEDLLNIHGRNELPEKKQSKLYIYCQQLWQPMPCMIWIAVVIEAAIQNYIDMAILLGIQFTNATIGYHEISKAKDAVAALKESLKPIATCKRDGKFREIDAALLVPGDLVLLGSGSAIPADCRVNHGEIDVDESALTGESLPVTKYQADDVKMGSTVVRGETEATIEFTGANTFFGKTAALLAHKEQYSNFQKLLISIMLILVVISFVLCIIVFVYLIYDTGNVLDSLSFTVVLVVASVPLAMEMVTTTTLALGSQELSKQGVIVAKLAAIEDLASMSILCSDKTGTLTQNKMEIQEETPIYKDGEDQKSLLSYAAMAAKWKEPPRDALDTLVLGTVDMNTLENYELIDYMPFDPTVKRTEGTVREKTTQKTFKTTKGAPNIIMKLIKDQKVLKQCQEDIHALGKRGIRALAIAKSDDGGQTWEMLGLLTFLDPPRSDTKQTIEDAIKYGVAVKMITGDHALIAKETAKVLGLGDYVRSAEGLPSLDPETKAKPKNLGRDYGDLCLAVDAFAQVYPEHKYLIVECLREMGYKTGMTGDGVNDAPALKAADVGIAVEGATDAARAAAAIVLTQPGLSTIVHGIILSRKIFARIRSFLTYRFAATLQLVIFFFIAVLALKPVNFMPPGWQTDPNFPDKKQWPAYFHMPVLMLILITLLNDGTLISIGYDNVIPRELPEKWNLKALFFVAFVLAFVALCSSILLLYFLLDSWTAGHVFQGIGLGGVSYGQITTAIYLKVSISDFLTLFSARTGDKFFWASRPSIVLIVAGGIALTASTIVALTWPPSYPDGIEAIGLARRKPYLLALYIWIYCLVWWIVQDFAKVGAYLFLEKYNIFGYNSTGKLEMPESTLKYIKEHKEEDLAKLT